MAIGMTYEQYWYGDPLMVRAFYKAEKLRQKKSDEQAWLQGLYLMHSINATVGNMFLEKGKTPIKYPEQPFSFGKDDVKENEVKSAEQEELEKNYALAYMTNMMMIGKSWSKNKNSPNGTQGGDVPWQTE